MLYNLHLVRPGERYGRNDVLINEYDDILVEFYDADFAGTPNFGPLGQFVSRYLLRTLDRNRGSLMLYGLDLQGDVAKWKLTPDQVREVFSQLDGLLAA